MKVLYITSHIDNLGPNNQFRYIVDSVSPDFKLFVIVLGERIDNLNTSIVEKRADVHYLNSSGLSSVLKAVLFSRKLINENNLDLVQVSGLRCEIVGLLINRIKKIVIVRNLTNINWITAHKFGRLIAKIQLRMFGCFDAIVSCSDGVHSHLSLFNLKSVVINNSIIYNKGKLYKRTYNDGFTNFITVSSSIPGKNIEFLVETFANDERFRKLNLTIIGNIEQSIIDTYAHVGNINICGRVENAVELFSSSDCFISASLHEGLPNAVLESLSVGTPVILSDIVSHLVFCEENNSVARLFNNNCKNDIYCKIMDMKNDKGRLYYGNYERLLDKKFSVDSMGIKYNNIYNELMWKK